MTSNGRVPTWRLPLVTASVKHSCRVVGPRVCRGTVAGMIHYRSFSVNDLTGLDAPVEGAGYSQPAPTAIVCETILATLKWITSEHRFGGSTSLAVYVTDNCHNTQSVQYSKSNPLLDYEISCQKPDWSS